MKISFIIFTAILSAFSAMAQSEVMRIPAGYFGKHPSEFKLWTDDQDYFVVDLKYNPLKLDALSIHTFKLMHRTKGMVTSFTEELHISKIYGYTYDEHAFTIYFDAQHREGNGDYSLKLPKNGTLPLLARWKTDFVSKGLLTFYNHNGSLYALSELAPKGFQISRITSPESFTVVMKNTQTGFFNSIKKDELEVVVASEKAAKVGTGNMQLYPFSDSLVATVEFKNRTNNLVYTQFLNANYVSGKIRLTTLPHAPGFDANDVSTVIVGNRFYQLRYGKNVISLGLFEYPSLRSLKELVFNESTQITIATSLLLQENGTAEYESDDALKNNRKILDKLTDGTPYMSGALDSGRMLLQWYSKNIQTTAMPTNAGASMSISSVEFDLHLNVCMDADFMPCSQPVPEIVYHRASVEKNLLLKNATYEKAETFETRTKVLTLFYKKPDASLVMVERNK